MQTILPIDGKGLRVFNGPRDRDPAPSDTVELIEEIGRRMQANNDRTNARIGEMQTAIDTVFRDVGHRTIGVAASGTGDESDRLKAFNKVMQTRGDGVFAHEYTASDFREYEEAFTDYLRRGNAALDKNEIRAALSVGSDPAGGFTVIPEIDPQPRERQYRTSPMRAVSTSLEITAGRYEGIHEKDQDNFGWVGEKEPRPETDSGDFAGFAIDVDEVYANVSITQRLLDDSAIDIARYIEGRLARRFNRAENTAFVSGDGVQKPRGFLDYKSAAVTTVDESRDWGVLQYVPTGAAGAFPYISGTQTHDPGCLFDLKAALNAELRSDAVWAMNSATFAVIEKMRDADGRSLVRQSLDAVTPDRLLGFPVVFFEDMPDVGSNSYSVAFGNFMVGYQIVDMPGVRMLRDPYTTKGKVLFYAYKRVGGDVVNFDAIKLLKFAAS